MLCIHKYLYYINICVVQCQLSLLLGALRQHSKLLDREEKTRRWVIGLSCSMSPLWLVCLGLLRGWSFQLDRSNTPEATPQKRQHNLWVWGDSQRKCCSATIKVFYGLLTFLFCWASSSPRHSWKVCCRWRQSCTSLHTNMQYIRAIIFVIYLSI